MTREKSFDDLIRRWAHYIRRTLADADSSRSDADLQDLQQDVHFRLWRTLSKGATWDKPASYIRNVAINTAIDASRRKVAHANESLETCAEGYRVNYEAKADLLGLLGHLLAWDTEKAEVIGLYLQGFTTDEIGTLKGRSEAWARNILYRTLAELREFRQAS